MYRTFSGYAKSGDWYSQVADLRDQLTRDGVRGIDLSMFYAVAYDGPMRFIWRRNEVWIKKSEVQTNI